MIDEHLSCYRALDMAPGCTWQQLRERYRLLAKQWHPDHFSDDTARSEGAEEKIKGINQAFFVLSRYYRTHGRLPAFAPEDNSINSDFASTPAPTPTSWTHTPQPMPSNAASTALRPSNYRIWLGGSAIIATLLYTVLAVTPEKTAVPPGAAAVPAQLPSAPAFGATSAAGTEHFTVGSTRGEVQAVQGVPSRVEGEAWYYGNAVVWFRDGTVSRWQDHPETPLKARADAPLPVRAHIFGIGSTMHEVRAIQGKPTHIGENVWDYGVSRVYFKGERVAGWDNSALNPLKVRNR